MTYPSKFLYNSSEGCGLNQNFKIGRPEMVDVIKYCQRGTLYCAVRVPKSRGEAAVSLAHSMSATAQQYDLRLHTVLRVASLPTEGRALYENKSRLLPRSGDARVARPPAT